MALRTPFANDAKTYGFEWLRFMVETGDVQEGVLGMQASALDFKVTLGTTGLRTTVNAGAAFVKGDSGVAGVGLSQGLFVVVNDANIVDADTLAAADPTNPRIDQVCLRVRDSSDLGTGADDATIVHLTGTPTAGATLDNRNGAAALPNDHLRLADILVPAAAATLLAGNVRDRRPWARGAFFALANAVTTDLTFSSTTYSPLATWTTPRLECSGAPLRVLYGANFLSVSTGGNMSTIPAVDAATVANMDRIAYNQGAAAGIAIAGFGYEWVLSVAAGSHLVDVYTRMITGNASLARGTASAPPQITIEELVRQNASNN